MDQINWIAINQILEITSKYFYEIKSNDNDDGDDDDGDDDDDDDVLTIHCLTITIMDHKIINCHTFIICSTLVKKVN